MNWGKVLQKGLIGIVAFIGAYGSGNIQPIVDLIPGPYSQMTVGAAVSGIILAAINWFKHRKAE